MELDRADVEALVSPVVPGGASLTAVALLRDAVSPVRGLAALFLPPLVVLGIALALHPDPRNALVMGALVLAMVASAAVTTWLGGRAVRHYAAGLTAEHLLVLPLERGRPPRATGAWTFSLTELRRLGVTDERVNLGGPGVVYFIGQLRIPAPEHPLRVDFVPALMPGNQEAFSAFRSALVTEPVVQ